MPAELARRESRLKKIREAKAELEKEAKERAEKQRVEAEARIAERSEQKAQTGKKAGGHDPKVPDPEQAKPEGKAQRNFTDPESRIMPDGANKGSFVQAYNAQAAVDSQAQVIVAAELTQQPNDSQQLVPMIEQVVANVGCKPEAVSADAGYWSEANVMDERVAGIDLPIATGRQKHEERVAAATGPPPEGAWPKEAMQHKLRTEAERSSTRCGKPSWNRCLVTSRNGGDFDLRWADERRSSEWTPAFPIPPPGLGPVRGSAIGASTSPATNRPKTP